jgi:tetratricopeptide (TPR) repeat protein
MARSSFPAGTGVARSHQAALLSAGGALVLAAAAVYWNSLGAPFIFDDIPGVVRNPTIRHLWPPWDALNPPVDGSGGSGRPVDNLTLALNYALGALQVRGYHAMNLALHALAALTLWGVLRRTLRICGRLLQPGAESFAWSAALLWTVHPLLTESVVCVVQRNEILGSLLYLLTLYGFIRSVEAGRIPGSSSRAAEDRSRLIWPAISFVACLAGMASKEIVATAPVLVFVYDRTFAAGTFRAAWQQRKGHHLALAGTWLLLGWLVWHNRQRGGTVGFGLNVSPWDYLLTQCRALVLYLQLSVWPHPLVLDYGWPVARSLGEVWWQAALVGALLAATLVALVRKLAVGFLGVSFFIVLAPSSSFVPLVTQTIAEHRMYLPLAAVVVLIWMGVWKLLRRRALAAALVVAAGLGACTMKRNQDYRSELAIWSDTVAKCPGNARAHGNLGRAYLLLGRWEEAIAACRQELQLAPEYNGDARANIGRALTELGRAAAALPYFEEGLRLRPDSFDVHNNYGIALAALGRWPEAVAQYERALRLQPDAAELHNNLANALVKTGRLSEALEHYETAAKLEPDFVEAEVNWGRSLAEAGRLAAALPHFEKVLRVRPDAAAHTDLANALAAAGRPGAAIPHYEAALRLQPDGALDHCNLGNAFACLGRFPEAVAQFEAAVRLQPAMAEAQHNLAAALMRLGRPTEALPHLEETVALLPDSAEAHHELALVLGEFRRWDEAVRQEEAALRLRPDFAEAREHLAWLRQQ